MHGGRNEEGWQCMADIKLFHIDADRATELMGASVAIEKTLQKLIERHLDVLLGVRFLASEYATGKAHGGRIDTLGLDENRAPVIIEYKRSINENVINQGLYYLDWLMDHKAEFTLLVMRHLGASDSDAIDWRFPRLLCIAADFTRYDQYAVQQINRNIELIRYRRYGNDLLLLEMVNTVTEQPVEVSSKEGAGQSTGKSGQYKTTTELLALADQEQRDRFDAIKTYLLSLGDDVQFNTLRFYFAFRRIKNFACVEVHPQARTILLYLKVDPDSISLAERFTRDVRKIGHFGTGDLEVTIRTHDDFERAKPLILQSYATS
jgi:predicted transport protein